MYSLSEMNNHIKKEALQKVYLLFGPEDYLKEFYTDKIKTRAFSEMGDGDYEIYSDKITPQQLADACESMPMFSEPKVVLAKNTGFFKDNKSKDILDFINYLSQGDTFLIFSEQEASPNNDNYKLIDKYGIIFECKEQNEAEIRKFLTKYAIANKRSINYDAVSLMINELSTNLTQLINEMQKLILLTKENEEIKAEHVHKVCPLALSAQIYTITDNIDYTNKEMAYKAAKQLLDNKTQPIFLISAISNHRMSQYKVKKMLDQHILPDKIAMELKLKPFIVRKIQKQVVNMTLDELEAKLRFCIKIDESVKSGNINEETAIDLMISEA